MIYMLSAFFILVIFLAVNPELTSKLVDKLLGSDKDVEG